MRLAKIIMWLAVCGLGVVIQTEGAEDQGTGITHLWRIDFPDENSESSPALALDGTVYQGTFNGWMLAVTADGKLKWRFKVGREIRSSPAVGQDGTVYFGSRDWNFYALTPAGKLKWKFVTGAWVDASPALALDGTIYFGSNDKNFYALTPAGQLKWKFAASNLISSSPAVAADGTIYFGSHDNHCYALTPEGKLKWKFKTGAEIDTSPTLGPDGAIYFASTDGNFYALNPDGTERWRLRTGGYTASSAIIDEERNLYLSANSFMTSITAEGKLRWQHPTEVSMEMSPALTANGQVIFSVPWLRIGGIDRTHKWPPLWTQLMHFNLAASPNVDARGNIYCTDGKALYAFKPATNAAPLIKSSWPMWRADAQHTGRVGK